MTRPTFPLLIGIVMTLTALSSAQTINPGPPGASAAFTSDDAVVQQARSLMNDGKFKEAEAPLAKTDDKPGASAQEARQEMLEIIRRTRREYSQTASEVLAKLKKDIPDATADDLKRWTEAGQTMSRMIDGQRMYFNREPVNIYRFSPEAKQRKEENQKPKKQPTWTLIQHLNNVIKEAESTGKAEVLPIKHRIKYVLTVDGDRPGAKAGSILRVWLPYPQEYGRQKNLKLVSASDGYQIAPNAIDGKVIGGAPQRTMYFEKRIDDPTKPQKFEETFEYDYYSYYPILKDELVKPLPADWNGAYLSERPPHIVFTPELKSTVQQIVGDETNPLAKARKIFHWISDNIRYQAEEEYTIIPSISVACLSRHKGDCGVHAILFITMCRAAGVPARWQSGWETKRTDNTMHDWAEFYVEPWGWLPADPSYGVQKESDDPKVRDFYLGHQDSYRMIFNLDYGRELFPPKKSMRSEPADFQRGEVELDGRNLYFDEWNYDMTIEWLTPEPK